MKQIKKLLPDTATTLRSDIVERGIIIKLNEVIDALNNLIPMKTPNNGETPEVDNTVGQCTLDKGEIQDIFLALTYYDVNNVRLRKEYIDDIINKLNTLKSKPVETYKEEPNNPLRAVRHVYAGGQTQMKLYDESEEVGSSGHFYLKENISVVYNGYIYYSPAGTTSVYNRKIGS